VNSIQLSQRTSTPALALALLLAAWQAAAQPAGVGPTKSPSAPGQVGIASPTAGSAAEWARWLQGTWEYRALDKANKQAEITVLQILAGGDYVAGLQYGAFKAETLSRGKLRIEQATAAEATLVFTPADQDPQRQPGELALATRVLRLDANRLRAADGSELQRRP
jgi:hypothetical protein